MPRPRLASSQMTEQAARAAERAAASAKVKVNMLTGAAGAHWAAALFAEIWSAATPGVPVPAHLIRAMEHAGNYVSGAWAGEELVGASVGFVALDHGCVSLHSHITGVTRRVQGSRVGFALKQHQRAWALERGIGEIGWTFDPLIRSNARFNLVKLGAVATSYHSNFYGPMADGINLGDRSDRCTVRWELGAPEVVAASEGRGSEAELEASKASGTVLLADAQDGGPDRRQEPDPRDPGALLCYVPADIVKMRQADPARASAWRQALGDTMGAAMVAGFVAGTVTRDGWYVLTRPQNEERAR